ncbi:hypothetical protein PINS_up016963 [Pythium insidiosum]|nr:hypothetical protein PINS_up016963 [Pythium insidiosum]
MEVLRSAAVASTIALVIAASTNIRSLGALKDLDDNLLNVRKEHEVSSKYAALRDKYKNKYGQRRRQ